VLIKAFARNGAILLSEYGTWLFSAKHSEIHAKFFANMLGTVLKDPSQQTLFSLLPLVAKSMNSDHESLINGGLMAITQLSL
jgi:hypothetical protein